MVRLTSYFCSRDCANLSERRQNAQMINKRKSNSGTLILAPTEQKHAVTRQLRLTSLPVSSILALNCK